MGEGYEYLIKKFADDSGHTAAEFYTNRTVVKLMTLITDPQTGESIYDPTCGSGGILLNSALHLKEQGKEYRTLKTIRTGTKPYYLCHCPYQYVYAQC